MSERDRDRETETGRQRETETERDRERGREGGREQIERKTKKCKGMNKKRGEKSYDGERYMIVRGWKETDSYRLWRLKKVLFAGNLLIV